MDFHAGPELTTLTANFFGPDVKSLAKAFHIYVEKDSADDPAIELTVEEGFMGEGMWTDTDSPMEVLYSSHQVK